MADNEHRPYDLDVQSPRSGGDLGHRGGCGEGGVGVPSPPRRPARHPDRGGRDLGVGDRTASSLVTGVRCCGIDHEALTEQTV